MIAFKNDYVQALAGAANTNDINTTLRRLTFVSVGGFGGFGQTTLGDTGGGGLSLSANDAVIDNGEEVVLSALTTVWDQDSDADVDNNGKVVLGVGSNPLVMRGILEVDFDDEATSSSYESVVTMGVTLKDN